MAPNDFVWNWRWRNFSLLSLDWVFNSVVGPKPLLFNDGWWILSPVQERGLQKTRAQPPGSGTQKKGRDSLRVSRRGKSGFLYFPPLPPYPPVGPEFAVHLRTVRPNFALVPSPLSLHLYHQTKVLSWWILPRTHNPLKGQKAPSRTGFFCSLEQMDAVAHSTWYWKIATFQH